MCCAVIKMNLIYLLAFAVVGQARALVELNCSDNATCIDYMTREFIRSIRQRKAVKLFDTFTIEPVENARQARSRDPLTRLLTSHAISFDWNDFTFKFSNTEDKNDVLDLEVYESRTAKDVSDASPKKSNSKVEEEVPQDKTPKRIKRRHKRKKVMQAVIPLLFGMKSAAIAIFSLAVVAVITIKAFLASKLALLVTAGMAAKKLYENYTGRVPETSNILWKLAQYIKFLFGLAPPLSAASMPMPLYSLPQNMAQTMPMFSPSMTMPANQ